MKLETGYLLFDLGAIPSGIRLKSRDCLSFIINLLRLISLFVNVFVVRFGKGRGSGYT